MMKLPVHRGFVAMFVLTLAVAITAMSVAIWAATDRQRCWVVSEQANSSNSVHQKVPERVTEGILSLNTLLRMLTISDGTVDIFNAHFGDSSLNSLEIRNCSTTASSEMCLQYGEHVRVKLLKVEGSDGLRCGRVSLHSELDNISSCIQLGEAHWYGAAEVFEQTWPIETWSLDLKPFVPGDSFHPGNYGGVQERYWLSSSGIAIHAPEDIPLHVSINASGNRLLCFVSQYKDSVYRNIDQQSVVLEYDICLKKNLTALHTAMAHTYWSKPLAAPHFDTMLKPIWSTWAQFKKEINNSTLMQYAQEIISYNFSISQLEIDDDWTPKYGDLIFDATKFPDPEQLIKTLKSLGIPAITLWIHPFVNFDAESYKFVATQQLVMMSGRTPGLAVWWDGLGSLLDFSNNQTMSWFLDNLAKLRQLGVDSFKFDAGETNWMPERSDMNQSYMNPSNYTKYYVDMAYRADPDDRRQEVRVGCGSQHVPVFVRMMDKSSVWGYDNGLRTLIPSALTFGLLGYPFVLPDMIGGNAYNNSVDAELFIRWLEINTFLPSIQFSIPPWLFGDPNIIDMAKRLLALRESFAALFEQLANESVIYGWPMVRPLWWVEPEDPNCLVIDDEFLLGNDLLVAPVVVQGAVSRSIYLPRGTWLDHTNRTFSGPKWLIDYSAPLGTLPHFQRV